jgi:diguanylate cyclase (GGDEF)-like protein
MHQRPRVEHTVLFGDVDGLKPVNDRHGHRAGDAVLVEVARRLRQVMRDGDFVARVSGDEFVVVLPTRVLSVVVEVRERITAALVEPIALPDGTKVRLSMSIGAATTETSLEPEDLLAAADAAMYVAKRERNGTT